MELSVGSADLEGSKCQATTKHDAFQKRKAPFTNVLTHMMVDITLNRLVPPHQTMITFYGEI